MSLLFHQKVSGADADADILHKRHDINVVYYDSDSEDEINNSVKAEEAGVYRKKCKRVF